MKIASWNINGILAAKRRGLLSVIRRIDADVFCFQEIKTMCQISLPGYYQYWNPANRKGYSGTMVISKQKPISVTYGLGVERLDREGRLIRLEFTDMYIMDVYVPNSQGSQSRLDYREEWDTALRSYVESLQKPCIICGDFNVARAHMDIYPENLRNREAVPGFLTQEREGMERLLGLGFVDAFRYRFPNRVSYTWWSNRLNKRMENRGWRLDYFLIPSRLAGHIRDVAHETDIMGSDHCPVTLVVDMDAGNALPNARALEREWQRMDWDRAEAELSRWQQQMAKAAYAGNWERVAALQKRIAFSPGCHALAVRHVSALGSTPGIDGVKWTTDAERMGAAKSLTSKNYHAQPYRCIVVRAGDRDRRIQIPTAYDKAMQVLYAYTLSPVAESLGERKSFAFRSGRSPMDAYSYIVRMFSGDHAPRWLVRADVRGCYDYISHRWLLQNIPMCRKVLGQFLGAGLMVGGELFPTTEGISQGVTLSPILAMWRRWFRCVGKIRPRYLLC